MKRKGMCKTPPPCFNGMVYWPQDSKCYTLYTRGPCPKGKLILIGKNRIAECKVINNCSLYGQNLFLVNTKLTKTFKLFNSKCENANELAQYFYKPLGTCYEHFTEGPCEDSGSIFLPGGKCGCHIKLPHYHEDTDQCYEIGR